MTFQEVITNVGDGVTGITESIVAKLLENGILTSIVFSKVLTLVIILIGIFVVIKFLNIISKPIKWIIIILLVILFASVLVTFI